MMHEIDVPCDKKALPQPPDTESHADSLSSTPQGVILIDVFGTDDDDDDDEDDTALEKTEENLKDGELSKGGGGAVSGADDLEQTGESSELLTAHRGPDQPPEVARGRSKWVKLRSTIKVACAFTPSVRKRQQLERQDSFLKRFSTRQAGSQYMEESNGGKEGQEENQSKETETKPPMNFVINPDETFMFVWLTGLTCAVLYNLWTCIAREAFPEIHEGFEPLWFTADALCDLVYLLDVVVQLRTGYLERGLIVYDSLKLTKHYVYSRDFVLDALSLVPLDLVQIYIGIHPIIRFPRFLKAYRLYRFVYMVETRTAFPNMWRVANLSHVLFLGCHWFAAFYFLISKAERFSTSWSYPQPIGEYASVTQKYLRSLYWSTLTLTTIGDLQSPESNWE